MCLCQLGLYQRSRVVKSKGVPLNVPSTIYDFSYISFKTRQEFQWRPIGRQGDIDKHSQHPYDPVGKEGKCGSTSTSAGNPKPRFNHQTQLQSSFAHTIHWHASDLPLLWQFTYRQMHQLPILKTNAQRHFSKSRALKRNAMFVCWKPQAASLSSVLFHGCISNH